MTHPALTEPHVGFPPGRDFLLLPTGPARATRAGLALYDGVEARQRVLLAAGRVLTAPPFGGRLLGREVRLPTDAEWWSRFLHDVAEPLLGTVAHVAVRRPPNGRVCALLMDTRGRPVGFVKLLASARSPFSALVRSRLVDPPLSTVGVPRTLFEGTFEEQHVVLFEPLPEGAHRRPPFAPGRVHAVAEEVRLRLQDLPRPADVPEHHVAAHTGFTPRNLRVTADGSWWLYDWDNVTWGPAAAPELRYWCAEFAYRSRTDVAERAQQVHRMLRRHFDDQDVLEAATWPGMLQTYRAVERELHRAVAQLASGEAVDGVRTGGRG